MARNQEKAQTLLARWLRYKEQSARGTLMGKQQRRPHLVSMCNDLHEAEKWRGTVIKDISRSVAAIQNSALGEHKIRDLNDKINKLLNEKRHWERRIVELGGVDYSRARGKEAMGMTVEGRSGYMYFGAARELPGVRELLEKSDRGRKKSGKKSRRELLARVNGDYFGFGDEDDNELLWREREQEARARLAHIQKWRETHSKPPVNSEKEAAKDYQMGGEDGVPRRRARLHARVLSQEQMDEIILAKRKAMLLETYGKDTPESRQLAAQLRLDKPEENEEHENAERESDGEDTEMPDA